MVGIDRPGHGLSEGRAATARSRRRSTCSRTRSATRASASAAPVALVGSSLGGIINWYALTREPDVEAVVCHNVAQPRVLHEPAMRREGARAAAAGARSRRTRGSRSSDRRLREALDSPEILDFARREGDRTFAWRITARSAASLFSFRPQVPWEEVARRCSCWSGGQDEMVSAAFTEEVVRAGGRRTSSCA